MLIRLTKTMRLRAAGVLAVLYMLCVLAPAAAFAFSDGSRAAHCLTDDNHVPTPVHVHKHEGSKTHVHGDGTIHDHSKVPDGHGKSSDSQCCGLACLSAIPASVIEIENPARVAAITLIPAQDGVAGNGPERLFRPPISLLSL